MKKIYTLIILFITSLILASCGIQFGGGTLTSYTTTDVTTTSVPTNTLTSVPTSVPTSAPTSTPTSTPTSVPTSAPTSTPTSAPTSAPTSTPTSTPTSAPTSVPTGTTTSRPTTTPTSTPTSKPTTQLPAKMNLSIIEFNDVHGYIMKNDNGTYGLSNAAKMVNDIRNEDQYDNTVVIANGDMFQGTALVRMTYGRVMVDAMNEVGFDACGIGNHEFDWGLDKITPYFDGDQSNGEANFPLLNANIKVNSTNELLKDDNIMSSTIIDKEGIKVGIISVIGNVYSSINYNMACDYTFDTNYQTIIQNEGQTLKDNGADIIIVNIHGGDSSGVTSYSPNQTIANLKYNGKYLVDAVINGHTHTRQSGTITRSGGTAMPIIQSAGNLSNFGRIDLTIDTTTKSVTAVNYSHKYPSSTAYNNDVENVIMSYYNQSKDVLEEVYCDNVALNKYDSNFTNWICNVMNSAIGSDVFVSNTGALRSSIDAGTLDFNDLYELNPFDNHIILITLTGAKIKQYINANSSYNFAYTTLGDPSNLKDSTTYKFAIVDYVYFGSYFNSYRPSTYVDTNLVMRDLLIEDLRLRKGTTFNPAVNNQAKIGQIYFG